tara:strand:- start:236 stop:412 length:177 start_codon:yes stop_codon:yes gene_type:complete
LIINEHKSIAENIAKQKKKRASIPKTYMQKQYERAEAKANAIKNHNEKLLKHLKEQNK